MARVVFVLGLLLGTVSLQTLAQSLDEWAGLRPDLYGKPYCSRRPANQQCCASRNDDCSMPIDGTKCYCDQFCNQHGPNRDCCPDYESHCLGRRECFHNNEYLPVGHTFRRSQCEECACRQNLGGSHLECWNICTTPRPETWSTCLWRDRYIRVGQRVQESQCSECICVACNNQVAEMQCINTCPPTPATVGACYHDGSYYPEGYRLRTGCKECTCYRRGNDYTMHCVDVCTPGPNPPSTGIVDVINRGHYGWTAYYYSFLVGKSLEEVYRQRTGVCPPGTTVLRGTQYDVQPLVRLPDQFDARTHWPGKIQGIHDQMDYPYSWAFSTAEVISDRMAVQTEGEDRHSMSAWNLVACVQNKSSCTSTTEAWRYVHRYGVTTEQCYPYEGGTASCRVSMGSSIYTTTCPVGSRDGYLYRMPQQYKVRSSEDPIRWEIYSNGPVQAHIQVKPDFFYYKSGVYRHVSSSIQGSYDASDRHLAVRIIGWGVERSQGTNIKYWLCTNSWGSQWGEDGYFRIRRGENEVEIESHVIGVWSKSSSNTVSTP